MHDLGPKNRALLERRAEIQAKIDDRHRTRAGQPHDAESYTAFLREIGYLLPEGPDFQIETQNVDPEIAQVPGPQLVVPITNARFALNAANARWGAFMMRSTAPMRWVICRRGRAMTPNVVRGWWRGQRPSWMTRCRSLRATTQIWRVTAWWMGVSKA